MRVLITGVAGFAGSHLAWHLLERGQEVAGLVYPRDLRREPASLPREVALFEADLLDGAAVVRAISRSEPEVIFHLAAFSNPEQSWGESRRTLETNIIGAHNLLQAAAESGLKPRVLLVGSCQQYGAVPEEDQPIREEQPQRPLTPYGVSKAAQEILGLRFFLSEKIPVLLVRPFNHTGPGQDPSYVCSNFARQIAEIESGRREPRILVGNLAPRRDFSDVRDVVRAYAEVMERGKPAEPYNVCFGMAYSIRQILSALIELTEADVAIEVDTTRYHLADTPLLLGDNNKLRCELGWEPRYSLRQTLSDLLDHWRVQLQQEE